MSAVIDGAVSTGTVPVAVRITTGSTSSVERMRITSGGNIGIGTSVPSVTLDVNGAVRAGSSATVTACGSGAANGEGSQRYNYTSHAMEYCNGTGWVSAAASATVTAPTTQVFTSGSGTYTTPAGVKWIEVTMVGGGGGGGGGGSSGVAGGAGGATTFGSSLLTANGGGGGGGGGAYLYNSYGVSGVGGSSALGGAGAAYINATGGTAAANSGSGGGGGGAANSNQQAGHGGGSGGYCNTIITSPAATYSYAVGAAGGGGTGTTSAGWPGGNGAAGRITVIEHYSN